MEEIIHNFNRSYNAIGEHWRTVVDQNTKLNTDITTLQHSLHQVQQSNAQLQKECASLSATIGQLQATIKKLEQKIVDADEDHKQFSKVSHLVAMEKENAKLRADLEFWMRRNVKADQHIQMLHNQADNKDLKASEPSIVEVSSIHHDQTPEPTSEPISDPPHVPEPVQETTVHNTEDVYVEKKIKGTIYLVKDNEVYEKCSDGIAPGRQVATLQLLNTGKTKIKWFKP